MIALKGVYDKGRIELANQAPVERADVIVIFPIEKSINKKPFTNEEKRIFDSFSGSIDRVIDERSEKVEALDEKYTSVN